MFVQLNRTKTFDFNCSKDKTTKIPIMYANKSVTVMPSESNIERVVIALLLQCFQYQSVVLLLHLYLLCTCIYIYII
jgi:hypothetical protein